MIISIASQKGGTGKTTTSISLAAGLALQNKKVLLIDMDSQSNSSRILLDDYERIDEDDTVYRTIIKRKELPIHTSKVKNLDISPSHILLTDSDIELTVAKDNRAERLKNKLNLIKDNYDYILIDCPPALSWLTVNSFTASDQVLIVVCPGFFELKSLKQLQGSLNEVKADYNPNLDLKGLLFTMSDPTVSSRESLKTLRQTYTDLVFKTIIPRNTDIRDSQSARMSIFDFNPNCKSAVAYKQLIKEIF